MNEFIAIYYPRGRSGSYKPAEQVFFVIVLRHIQHLFKHPGQNIAHFASRLDAHCDEVRAVHRKLLEAQAVAALHDSLVYIAQCVEFLLLFSPLESALGQKICLLYFQKKREEVSAAGWTLKG